MNYEKLLKSDPVKIEIIECHNVAPVAVVNDDYVIESEEGESPSYWITRASNIND